MGEVEGSQAWLESTPSCYEHRSDCLSEEGHWAEWELSWDCHKSLRLKKGKTILSPFFNFNGCKPEWRVIQIWWPRREPAWGVRLIQREVHKDTERTRNSSGLYRRARGDKASHLHGMKLPGMTLENRPNPLCVCVRACTYGTNMCADVKPWCELSFLLTLILWSPLLPTLCSPCKQTNKPFLDSVTSLRSISMVLQNSSAFHLRGYLLPGRWWKQPLPRRAQLHIRGGKRKFYQNLNPTVQHELLEELDFLGFPRCMWSPSQWGLGKIAVHSLVSSNNVLLRNWKEVRPQEQNWFFLLDFLVTSWSNIFYQS